MAKTATKTSTKNSTPRKAKPKRKPAATSPSPKRDTTVNDKLVLTGLEAQADNLFQLKQKAKDLSTQIKEAGNTLIEAVRPEREKTEKAEKRSWPTVIVRSTDGEHDCQVIWQHKFSKLNGDAERLSKELGKHAATFLAESVTLKANAGVTAEVIKKAIGAKAFKALSEVVEITEDIVVAPEFMAKRATLHGQLPKKAEAAVQEIEAKQASPQVKTR